MLGTWGLPVQLIRVIVKKRIIDGVGQFFADDGNQATVIEICNSVVPRTILRICWYTTAGVERYCNSYRSSHPARILI
jgi:hypothetical protein